MDGWRADVLIEALQGIEQQLKHNNDICDKIVENNERNYDLNSQHLQMCLIEHAAAEAAATEPKEESPFLVVLRELVAQQARSNDIAEKTQVYLKQQMGDN